MNQPASSTTNAHQYCQWLDKSFDWSKDVHRGYFSPEGKPRDRVIKHDTTHLLLVGQDRKRPIQLRFEDEYAIAMVQAVLEGTSLLSRVAHSDQCSRMEPGHEVITENTVRRIIIPKSVEFLTWALTQRGRELPATFRTDVSSAFIRDHLELGKNFRRKFREKYGVEFVSMDLERFLGIPFPELQTVFAAAREQTRPDAKSPGR